MLHPHKLFMIAQFGGNDCKSLRDTMAEPGDLLFISRGIALLLISRGITLLRISRGIALPLIFNGITFESKGIPHTAHADIMGYNITMWLHMNTLIILSLPCVPKYCFTFMKSDSTS